MRVLVIGNGGREHAMVWKIAQSEKVEAVFAAPGNPGIATEPKTQCLDVPVEGDFSAIKKWARQEKIAMTFVGPEAPLAEGIVDAFEAEELPVFGPCQKAAQLESSKIFCKDFMKSAAIPTADAAYFREAQPALDYLKTRTAPYVIKAYGLAAGKGAIVAPNWEEAENAVRDCLERNVFGAAGEQILIEDFMEGEEASMLAFTDGRTVLPLSSAQDHKPIGEGDTGPNTGGMGAYSPAPLVSAEMEREILETILQPTVDGLRQQGIPYKGILYAGLMIGPDKKPRVVEFNCRFGDPETQPLLMRLKTDLVEIALAVQEERLADLQLEWAPDPAVCVVLASGGYPGSYAKGHVITGLEAAADFPEAHIFHAGTRREGGQIVTNGGRVLGVTARGTNLQQAVDKAYSLCDQVHFEGVYLRRDIAAKAL